MSRQLRSPEDYTVAILCALEIELRAVRGTFDKTHPRLPLSTGTGDTNIYTCGELHGHHVVACCLPGQYGKGSAATVATNLSRTFTSIKWRLMVGIGGGIPSDKHPIRLGDVVVSMPSGDRGGVVQYDLGKQTADDFVLTGFLVPPPAYLRNAAINMQTDHRFDNDNRIAEHVAALLVRYPHLVEFGRPELTTGFDVGPKIHYGMIASGDSVIKSCRRRDELLKKFGDVLCVEMEAAGISTAYECIVIRGISDLADENKNDEWQGYAAATAAACAKELLERVVPEPTRGSRDHQLADPSLGYRCHAVQHGGGIQQVGLGNMAIRGNGNTVLR